MQYTKYIIVILTHVNEGRYQQSGTTFIGETLLQKVTRPYNKEEWIWLFDRTLTHPRQSDNPYISAMKRIISNQWNFRNGFLQIRQHRYNYNHPEDQCRLLHFDRGCWGIHQSHSGSHKLLTEPNIILYCRCASSWDHETLPSHSTASYKWTLCGPQYRKHKQQCRKKSAGADTVYISSSSIHL